MFLWYHNFLSFYYDPLETYCGFLEGHTDYVENHCSSVDGFTVDITDPTACHFHQFFAVHFMLYKVYSKELYLHKTSHTF